LTQPKYKPNINSNKDFNCETNQLQHIVVVVVVVIINNNNKNSWVLRK
jgi:hypothetical protein